MPMSNRTRVQDLPKTRKSKSTNLQRPWKPKFFHQNAFEKHVYVALRGASVDGKEQ